MFLVLKTDRQVLEVWKHDSSNLGACSWRKHFFPLLPTRIIHFLYLLHLNHYQACCQGAKTCDSRRSNHGASTPIVGVVVGATLVAMLYTQTTVGANAPIPTGTIQKHVGHSQ
jgi:hypothetical protein